MSNDDAANKSCFCPALLHETVASYFATSSLSCIMVGQTSRVSMAHVIDACDNYPYISSSDLASEVISPLHLTYSDGSSPSIKPVGWIRPHFGRAMNQYFETSGLQPFLIQQINSGGGGGGGGFWYFEEEFLKKGMDEVNGGMARMVRKMKDEGLFQECLDGE
jgi:hypothetical protein